MRMRMKLTLLVLLQRRLVGLQREMQLLVMVCQSR